MTPYTLLFHRSGSGKHFTAASDSAAIARAERIARGAGLDRWTLRQRDSRRLVRAR